MVLALVRNRRTITTREMSSMMGISERQCKRIVAELKKSGILKRDGSSRNGEWIISGPENEKEV